MTCLEFLDLYSDYRDGTLHDPDVRHAVDGHLGECLRCRRLAKTMDQGLALLHESAGSIEPSARFRAGLEHRLRSQVAIGNPLAPTHAGLAAALLLTAALGLMVVEGLTRGDAVHDVTVQAGFEAPLSNVTLPAFAHSTLEFHGTQEPLGSFVAFSR